MGKIGAIILSFTILFQSFSFEPGDVYNFSTFINHVSSHIESGDNFADFIDLHYGDKANSHQNKHKEHQDLPFKHQHVDSQMQLVFVFNSLNIDLYMKESKYGTMGKLADEEFIIIPFKTKIKPYISKFYLIKFMFHRLN